jgi:hypothetical protein
MSEVRRNTDSNTAIPIDPELLNQVRWLKSLEEESRQAGFDNEIDAYLLSASYREPKRDTVQNLGAQAVASSSESFKQEWIQPVTEKRRITFLPFLKRQMMSSGK